MIFTIYSAERHPGEPGYLEYHHPQTHGEKMKYAKIWAGRTDLGVAVDTRDLKVQRFYGKVPNDAFVVDRNGILVFMSQWADSKKIEVVIDKLLEYEKSKKGV